MALRILDATTRAAVNAATTQQGVCEALIETWAGGNVTARLFAADGTTLLRTLTLGPFTVNSATPRGVVAAAHQADTHVATGTPGLWVFRSGGTDIFSIDAGTSGASVNHAGNVLELCTPTLAGVVFTANSALPTGDPFAVMSNGIWSWFNKPEALRVGDDLYVGTTSSTGTIRVTQQDLDTQTATTFQLSAGFGADDHNNASLVLLPSGRLAAFYAAHPDQYIRMRVQTTAGDVSAWSTQQDIEFGSGGLTDYYYPCPVILSQDTTQQFLFFRWLNGSGGFDLAYAVSSNLAAGPATFGSAIRLATNGAQRPYWSMSSNGVDRIDFLLSEGNPNEITGLVWHFYAELDGSNVLRFYTTDGTEISGSLPHSITSKFTNVVGTSDRKHWVWDITTGSDGQPWALFNRMAANDGSDHRYHFARWNGSAWTHAEFASVGGPLYAGEPFYSPGMNFSRSDPTRIYAGIRVTGVDQISLWEVGSGTTVTKTRDVTTGDGGTRARPVGVINSDSRCEALWWEGTYTSYTSFSTDVKGIAA